MNIKQCTCGSKYIDFLERNKVAFDKQAGQEYNLSCPKCGYETGWIENQDELFEKWNSRNLKFNDYIQSDKKG